MLTDAETGRPFFNHENTCALGPRNGGIGPGGDADDVGNIRVTDEDFGAVDDIIITVPNGSGLEPGYIGTGVGFGEPEGNQMFAGGQFGKISPFLFFASRPA